MLGVRLLCCCLTSTFRRFHLLFTLLLLKQALLTTHRHTHTQTPLTYGTAVRSCEALPLVRTHALDPAQTCSSS